MTSKELNLKLLTSIPEISDIYYKETSWQDGNETGSHVVYADVFVPFVKAQINDNNEQTLIKVFNYVESLLGLNDEYANEVVALSFLETLIFDEDVDNTHFIQFVKPNTLELIEEIINNIKE